MTSEEYDKIVPVRVVEAGEEMASVLFDAQISRDMGGLGGAGTLEDWRRENAGIANFDLIEDYVNGVIPSLTAIYIAMCRKAAE